MQYHHAAEGIAVAGLQAIELVVDVDTPIAVRAGSRLVVAQGGTIATFYVAKHWFSGGTVLAVSVGAQAGGH